MRVGLVGGGRLAGDSRPFRTGSQQTPPGLELAFDRLPGGWRGRGRGYSRRRGDLLDAFQTPAAPDWTVGQPSLPILYARTADHPQRTRFVNLLPRLDDLQALREAQQILIRCGAVSYCVYHLLKRHQAARQLLAGIPLADPNPMRDLLAQQTQPLIRLLQASGAELPAEVVELSP